MHGSAGSKGWIVHLMAGAALGAVIVLFVWIFSGGRPFGEVVGTADVSAPTTAATQKPRTETPAERASRLASRPPTFADGEGAGAGELRFKKPAAKVKAARKAATRKAAERKAAALKQRRAARRKRARRAPVVRVVSPPPSEQPQSEPAPVAVVPAPVPTAAAPRPAAPPRSGAGGGSAKPKSPGPTLWAGEG